LSVDLCAGVFVFCVCVRVHARVSVWKIFTTEIVVMPFVVIHVFI